MCDRTGVVKPIGGIELVVAVNSDYKGLGPWLRGLNSVVKLLGGRGAIEMVSSGWWH